METTIKQKINNAFKALRKAGYVAKQNWKCCQGCGLAALPDDVEKYVFYHAQDADCLKQRGYCYLAWGGDGNEITTILKNSGLDVEWDGTGKTRIGIGKIPQTA